MNLRTESEGYTRIARWESRGGAYVVELYKQDGSGFSYRGTGCGGYLGNDWTEAEVLEAFQARVDSGYFQPDANKTPMKRTA
jgi:hypothetical protein